MANTYKNSKVAGITSETDIITGSGQSIVIGLSIANTDTNDAKVTVNLTDNDGSNAVSIVKDGSVPINNSLIVIGGEQKLVIADTQKVKVSSDYSVDVVLSYLEIS